MTLAFLLGSFGLAEIGIIVLVLLLLFGAKRVPQVARALGSSISEFKKGRKEGENQGNEHLQRPQRSTDRHETKDEVPHRTA